MPDIELYRRLLEMPDTVLFRGRSSVPKAHPYVSPDEIIDSYAKLLSAWTVGDSKVRRLEFDACAQMVSTSNLLTHRTTSDAEKVSISSRTPCIDFFSGLIYLDSKGHIGTCYSSGLWMGFHITYPRVFSAAWTSWESVSADEFAEFEIYRQICELVKPATIPLVLISGDRKVRTPIRYSPSLRDSLVSALKFAPWPLQLYESPHARKLS